MVIRRMSADTGAVEAGAVEAGATDVDDEFIRHVTRPDLQSGAYRSLMSNILILADYYPCRLLYNRSLF